MPAKPIHQQQVKAPEVSYATPVKILPKQVEDKLSSYASRQQEVPRLPLERADIEEGAVTKVTGNNILYINPSSAYAIEQFRVVWPKISTTPTVVWVATTPNIAMKEWHSAGYTANPLPSPSTLYTTSRILEPDAYHVNSQGYQKVGGVLRNNEINKWLGFFNAN